MRYFLRVPTAHYFNFIGRGAENILGLVGLSASPSLRLESYTVQLNDTDFVSVILANVHLSNSDMRHIL